MRNWVVTPGRAGDSEGYAASGPVESAEEGQLWSTVQIVFPGSQWQRGAQRWVLLCIAFACGVDGGRAGAGATASPDLRLPSPSLLRRKFISKVKVNQPNGISG